MNDLFHVIRGSYSGRNLWAHLVAALATFVIVVLGLDWYYFLYMNEYVPTVIVIIADSVGWIVPILLPMALIMAGRQRKNARLEEAGWTVVRAEVAALLIVLLYKAISGRVSPPIWGPVVDISREFNFGFFRHSVYGGWPSSHTAVAFATATSLTGVFSRRPLLWWTMFIYAYFIGLGEAIGFHWFSEAVAGAIVGSVVGYVAVELHTEKFGPSA